jgi:DNA-binding transcriptional LysR family regulator
MNLSALDLNLLVALDRLLRAGSVTAAAAELGITQPAMSRTLGRLRDALGDPLFVRDGRSVVPTARARELAGPVEEALDAVRRVFERPEPFDAATASGEVRIGLGDETQASFADAILALLWKRAPGIDVRIRPLSVASVGEARRGDIELALAPDLSALPRGQTGPDLSEFVFRKLYERRFVVVSSPRHPRRRFTLASYAACNHLVAGPDATGRGFVDDYLEAAGHRRRVAAAVSSFRTAARVVARTDLVATLPDDVVRTVGVKLVSATPPVDLPVLPMGLLWHPRHTTDPRHRFIRETVAEAIRGRMA